MGEGRIYPIQIFLSTSLNHTAISSSLKTFGAEKTLIRPLKTSTQLSLFHLAFRMTEGRWAQPYSTDDRQKLEESIETNSGVQYLLDHPHGKL